MKKILAAAAILSLSQVIGCASPQVKVLAAQAEDELVASHDAQLRISKKALCSSAMTAVHRAYGDSPEDLRFLFGLCGWSERNIGLMMGE